MPGDQTASSTPRAGTLVPLLSSLDWQPSQGSPDEILNAYLNYWTVIIKAFQTQDPAHLDEVATGTEYALNRKLLAELKAANHTVEMAVEHKVRRFASRGDETVLTDVNTITARVTDLNTNTVTTVPGVPYGDSTRPTYLLVRVGGTWKVSYAE